MLLFINIIFKVLESNTYRNSLSRELQIWETKKFCLVFFNQIYEIYIYDGQIEIQNIKNHKTYDRFMILYAKWSILLKSDMYFLWFFFVLINAWNFMNWWFFRCFLTNDFCFNIIKRQCIWQCCHVQIKINVDFKILFWCMIFSIIPEKLN